jgi:hypothetical protein
MPARLQAYAARLSGTLRAAQWWDYKLVPILSIFYATAVVRDVSIASIWPSLIALLLAIAPGAAYVSIVNDVTDRADDLRAGKTNRLADKPSWLLALLLAAPLAVGMVFSLLWRDDPPLMAAYLCAWVAFSLYCVPPFRLKTRGLLGVIADASGAHLFPTLVAALLSLRAAGEAIDPIWIAALAAWAFGCGLRGILWHQLHDLETDRLRHSRRTAGRLAACVALPLEAIGLAVLLWQMRAVLPVAFLLLYAAFAALRHKLWNVMVVIAAPRERYAILGQEYYGLLLPVAILMSSALHHPLDCAVLVAHLLVFPVPAVTLARQAPQLLRDLVQSNR